MGGGVGFGVGRFGSLLGALVLDFLLLSALDAAVLEPDFHLRFGEVEVFGEFDAVGADHVLALAELDFEAVDLALSEDCSDAFWSSVEGRRCFLLKSGSVVVLGEESLLGVESVEIWSVVGSDWKLRSHLMDRSKGNLNFWDAVDWRD